jgi:hypothetical protein
MKTRWLVLLTASAVVPALLIAAATSADEPSPQGAGAILDGGADGDTDADAGPPPLRSYSADPLSAERSAEPKAKEWEAAPKVALDRPSHLLAATEGPSSTSCEARRLREWIRIRCTMTTGAISLLGGEHQGLAMHLDPVKKDDFSEFPDGADIVFPVRRGDRRVIEWLMISFGYKGMQSMEPFLVLSEQWPEGDERPTIVVQ